MLVAGGGSCSFDADRARPGADLPLGLGALREAGARTAIVAPLLARGRPLGLLVLADERALAPSTERAELVELIAVQAASNLRTAAAVAELRHRASTDPLTGLGHRGAFAEALGASHRRPIATAVALCDLDRFKELNDRLGHQEGDRALRRVGAGARGRAAPRRPAVPARRRRVRGAARRPQRARGARRPRTACAPPSRRPTPG